MGLSEQKTQSNQIAGDAQRRADLEPKHRLQIDKHEMREGTINRKGGGESKADRDSVAGSAGFQRPHGYFLSTDAAAEFIRAVSCVFVGQ
jgi:hypothetical protein